MLVLFYDGPEANGIFDEMLSIPSIFADVSTRTFADFIGPLSATFGTDGVGYVEHNSSLTLFSGLISIQCLSARRSAPTVSKVTARRNGSTGVEHSVKAFR